MKIHELTLTSNRKPKRVGRGISAGGGKTAGRGTKGQKARTGGTIRLGFEGGQNPLAKRLPKKRGFKPLQQTVYQVVNLGDLIRLAPGGNIGPAELAAAGLIKYADRRVKLLGAGELTAKLSLKVHAASASARAAIEKAGGQIEVVKFVKAPSKKATRPAADADDQTAKTVDPKTSEAASKS